MSSDISSTGRTGFFPVSKMERAAGRFWLCEDEGEMSEKDRVYTSSFPGLVPVADDRTRKRNDGGPATQNQGKLQRNSDKYSDAQPS